MNINTHFFRRAAAVAGVTLTLASASTAATLEGYVIDSKGQQANDGFSNCLRSSFWTEKVNTPECDPVLAAKMEAERLKADKIEAERLQAELQKQAQLEAEALKVAKLEAEKAQLAEQKRKIIVLSDKRNVMFASDSAILTAAGLSEMQKVETVLNGMEGVNSITIVGHTDSRGTDSYNFTLSMRRALSVKRFLASRGISENVLNVQWLGERNPVASNMLNDGRAKNRRVEIIVSGNTLQQ